MADEFCRAVDDGIKLSRRLYFGKDRAVAPPKPPTLMERSSNALLPKAPMVYAVIYDPGMVDNPDIASYQPYVYGRCDPPALIPLQMNAIEMEIDCYLDTAFITVSGTWRLHCVAGSRSCDCRLAIPVGHQGSILGVEVNAPRKSYSTQLVVMDENQSATPAQNGGYLKSNIFTLTIPEIDGGSNLSIKMNWSQNLECSNGEYSLNVPFSFPDFVNPTGKRMSKREKIRLNVDVVAGSELLFKTTSHSLKQEVRRHAGSMSFLCDNEVLSWSKDDFNFSYAVSSSHINGGVLLESASAHDFDQREMFYIYLSPGDIQNKNKKVFKKDIIFIIDISGSMQGKLMDDTKNALLSALSKLNPDDLFTIIAFNGESYLFSKSMELASSDAVERASEWISTNFVAGGGTDISHPLNMAIEMLSSAQSSVPIIFLVTDGTVEDERQICAKVKNHMINGESICPRIQAFLGVGQEWLTDASKSTNPSAGLPKELQLGLLSPFYLRRLFERLGATYIKLGQFIASAPTLFPAEYVQEFQNCFDRAPPVSFEEIQSILRKELGRPIESVYEYVDPTPLASASIAQVHGARLKGSQEDVVIKVLKPGIEDILVADLNFVYVVARILEFLNPEISRTSLVGIVKDIRESMLEEVDFYKEAANVEAFRRYLEATGLTGQATAPKVYKNCSTKQVLTMQRLYGVPLTDLDSISSLVTSPETSVITALNVWFGSLLACESFHADVHAGNLWLLRDGRIGFLDFGIVGRISPKTWAAMEVFLGSIAIEDYDSMASSLIQMGATSNDVNANAFSRDLEKVFSSIKELDTEVVVAARSGTARNPAAISANVVVDERQMNALFLDVVRVSESYGLKFPREFALLLKQLLYFDRYTRLLAPNLNMLQDQRISIASNRRSNYREI